jgi:hypothetical protein
MKNLIDTVTKVIKGLEERGYGFTPDNNTGLGDITDVEVEGHRLLVSSEEEREEWSACLQKVHTESVQGPEDLGRLLITILGQPNKVIEEGNGDRVLSWKPARGVKVTFFIDTIDFTQRYTKV